METVNRTAKRHVVSHPLHKVMQSSVEMESTSGPVPWQAPSYHPCLILGKAFSRSLDLQSTSLLIPFPSVTPYSISLFYFIHGNDEMKLFSLRMYCLSSLPKRVHLMRAETWPGLSTATCQLPNNSAWHTVLGTFGKWRHKKFSTKFAMSVARPVIKRCQQLWTLTIYWAPCYGRRMHCLISCEL